LDNVVDSNDGKTGAASLALTPVEQFSLVVNGTYGPSAGQRRLLARRGRRGGDHQPVEELSRSS